MPVPVPTERSPLLGGNSQSPPNLIDSDSFSGDRIYICKVCSKRGTIPNNFNGRVVKCLNCGEGTPICLPPPGKKYVRCVCHCLLVCSTTALFLRCPRRTCQRIVEVSPDQGQPREQQQSEMTQQGDGPENVGFSPEDGAPPSRPQGSRPVHQQSTYVCPHCKHLFDWPSGRASAKCTFCTDWCVLDSQWPRRRAVYCYLFSVVCVLAVATLAATTYVYLDDSEEIIAGWIAGAVVAIIAFFSGLRYTYLSRCVVLPVTSSA